MYTLKYVATVVIQFRADETAHAFLTKLGINPNDFGREAFERSLRMLRADRNMDEVNRMRERIKGRLRGKPLFGGKSGVKMLREDRDSH